MSESSTISNSSSVMQLKPFEWILNDRYRWLFHVLFWVVLYLDEFLAVIGITPALEYPLEAALVFIADLAIVYFNLYFLIPKFLLKNHPVKYLLFSILTVLLNVAFMHYLYYAEEGYDGFSPLVAVISDGLVSGMLVGTAAGLKLFKILIQEKQRRQEAENMSLQTEIAYLKDQINPHFLFNSLNNLYVQIRKRPQEAAESVLLLSDLLRYQLYDSSKDQVYLNGEIEYLKNYLELDKMRKTDVEIEFTVSGDPNGKMVAPYLFLPFIENAIKHGSGLEEQSFIKVHFEILGRNEILFSISNSIPEHAPNHPAGGIGLANVKRRLVLLYPEQHTLNIKETEQEYRVELRLQIQ